MQCRAATNLSASQHTPVGRGASVSVRTQPVRPRRAVGSTKGDAPPTTEEDQKEKEGECPFPFLHKDGGEGVSEPRAHGATQVLLFIRTAGPP